MLPPTREMISSCRLFTDWIWFISFGLVWICMVWYTKWCMYYHAKFWPSILKFVWAMVSGRGESRRCGDGRGDSRRYGDSRRRGDWGSIKCAAKCEKRYLSILENAEYSPFWSKIRNIWNHSFSLSLLVNNKPINNLYFFFFFSKKRIVARLIRKWIGRGKKVDCCSAYL